MMKIRVLIFACIVLSGCAAPRGWVAVMNQSSHPIARASVALPGYEFEWHDIAPGDARNSMVGRTIPTNITVRLEFPDGRSIASNQVPMDAGAEHQVGNIRRKTIIFYRDDGTISLGSTFAPGEAPSPPRLPDADFIASAEGQDITEAVFRHQMDHPGEYKNPDAWYLAVCQKDPTAQFMARFESSRTPVQPVSRFKSGGVGLHVDDIHRVGKTKVIVRCGFYQASLSATFHEYILKKRKGKWTVVKETMTGVS